MDHQTIGRWKIRPGWIVAAGLAVLALVAVGVPLVSLLSVGVLLLCPLLMWSMHGGGHAQERLHPRTAEHEHDPRDAASAPHLREPRPTQQPDEQGQQ